MPRFSVTGITLIGLLLLGLTSLQAATLEATYIFDGNLTAQESAVPALTPVNPLRSNTFATATVYGSTRGIYTFNGNGTPTDQQAGLVFDDSSSLISPTSYSLELVFSFSSSTGWRRIVDVQNRQSDAGFYVNPNNQLSLYPSANGTTTFSANTYYDVILTNDGTHVTAYLNGNQEFTVADSQMNLNNSNNPSQAINLFLDNIVGGGLGEFSSGNIALFEAFNGVLSSSDAASLAANPFANVPSSPTPTVPEPGTYALTGVALAVISAFIRRRRSSI